MHALTVKITYVSGWDGFLWKVLPQRRFAAYIARVLLKRCNDCPTCVKHVSGVSKCKCGGYCTLDPEKAYNSSNEDERAEFVIVLPSGRPFRVANRKGEVVECRSPELPMIG